MFHAHVSRASRFLPMRAPSFRGRRSRNPESMAPPFSGCSDCRAGPWIPDRPFRSSGMTAVIIVAFEFISRAVYGLPEGVRYLSTQCGFQGRIPSWGCFIGPFFNLPERRFSSPACGGGVDPGLNPGATEGVEVCADKTPFVAPERVRGDTSPVNGGRVPSAIYPCTVFQRLIQNRSPLIPPTGSGGMSGRRV